MAVKEVIKRKFVISAADAFHLKDASDGLVSTWLVHLVADGSWSGTVKVKSRAMGTDAVADSVTPVQVPYLKRYLNGVVADDTLVSTDITTTSIILIPASGQSIVIDCTTYGAGTMAGYCFPLEGAAA
jgi:hypothetical protein